MATIEKHRGSWRVRESTGGKYRTVAKVGTKIEAEAIRAKLEVKARARSQVIFGTSIPMAELIEKWRLAKISEGNDPLHTDKAATRICNLCEARLWAGTASITAHEVATYRQAGGSPRTCVFLGGILRWAKDHHDQPVDERALVALRAGKSRREPLHTLLEASEVQEMERTASQISPNAGLLVHCLSTYGWRPIEAARMRVGDFDRKTALLTRRVKGGDTVRHPLLLHTAERLREAVKGRRPKDPLFIDPRSGKAFALADSRGISQWARDHLPHLIYRLKDYALSTMSERGVADHVIILFSGHRTISQLNRYKKTNHTRALAALEVLERGSLGGDATHSSITPEVPRGTKAR